ncbi:MAG: hypothetical protein H0W72_08245 [Planctomycetes bacterium]|nr:hypothetical protein [Planctomycetota bacterium]
MHHASARTAITRILAGEGFGEQALALVHAACLSSIPGFDEALHDTMLARSLAMASDAAGETAGAPALAVPTTPEELCTRLAPAIAANPAQIGLQLACLHALAELWPHVASHERPRLLQRFLASAASRQAPTASMVTVAQLRNWARDLPTCSGDVRPSVASLKGLLNESQPNLAYRILAEHLGCEMDLATLSWVLGALGVQVLLQVRDPAGIAAMTLAGTVASERLTGLVPPEIHAALVSQLAHQLWWCRNRAGLPQIRGCLDTTQRPFAEAISSGDITGAQRAARAASTRPEGFWTATWEQLSAAINLDDRAWLRAVTIVTATAWRAGDAALAPDDAAAFGGVLADLRYHASELTPRALHALV